MGAGHAGLAVAHDLRRDGREVLIVDAYPRVGEAWRRRWDSLRLFTPRDLNVLPQMPFPRGDDPFPNKDEVADYQERYAREMGFASRLGAPVRSLHRTGKLFTFDIGPDTLRAESAVVAGGHYHTPSIPEFASRLDASVLQLHSSDYRRASQLPEGPVVVVGAANSGGDIAVELARERPTTIAIGTRHPRVPLRRRSPTWWKLALLRDRVLHERTEKLRWLPWPLRPGGGIEVDLDRAAREHGLRLAPRAVDAEGDTIRFADGTAAAVRTVIWATGFRSDHSWIDARKEDGVIRIGAHGRTPVPGLHFVRGRFLFAISRHARDVARDVRRSG